VGQLHHVTNMLPPQQKRLHQKKSKSCEALLLLVPMVSINQDTVLLPRDF